MLRLFDRPDERADALDVAAYIQHERADLMRERDGLRAEVAALRECFCAGGECKARRWLSEIPTTTPVSSRMGTTEGETNEV